MQNSAKNRPRSRLHRLVTTGVVALLAASGVSTLATAAQADVLGATITDPRVTLGYDPAGTGTEVDPTTPITTGSTLTFHADWAIAGRANAGDTFDVPIPSQFQIASSEPFTLLSAGQPVATCQYTAPNPAITCTIVGGPHAGITGNIWFTGRLVPPTEPGETPEWEIGGDVIVLPNPVVPPPGPYTPPFGTMKGVTYAAIVEGKARLTWGVYMWPGCEGAGIPAGTCVEDFVVADRVTSTNLAMPHTIVPDSFLLERWERAVNPDGTWAQGSGVDTGVDGTYVTLGQFSNGSWTINTAALQGEVIGTPQLAADGKSLTFSLESTSVPYQYRLRYSSVADGAVTLDNELFSNTAVVNGEPLTAEAHPRTQGGGGADAGAYTSFTAKKVLVNNSSATLPTEYTLTASQGQQVETIVVGTDRLLVNSPYFPATNGDITICEALPGVPGVDWAPYTIVGTGVTGPDAQGCYTMEPAPGQRIELTVTNQAEPQDGTFTVTKTVDADDRLIGLIGDEEFTIEYTVNGLSQTPLAVRAGETVTSPAFADGSEIVLVEVKPEVFGVVWGQEVFSQSQFTIDAGVAVNVNLTNPATPAKVSIGDYTWVDENRDGIQQTGEPALAGVELTLTNPDGNPVTDVTGALVGPVTSDANGAYRFENLPPLADGSYTVTVTSVPDGYTATVADAGADPALDSSDGVATSYLPLNVDGAADWTLDFGFVTPETTPTPEPTTPTPTPEPTTPVPTTEPPLPTPQPSTPTLPVTGAEAGNFLSLGAVLVATGALVLIARRRVTAER